MQSHPAALAGQALSPSTAQLLRSGFVPVSQQPLPTGSLRGSTAAAEALEAQASSTSTGAGMPVGVCMAALVGSTAMGISRRGSRKAASLLHSRQVARATSSLVQRRAVATQERPDTVLWATTDKSYNVPDSVRNKLGKDLLLQQKHPLGILWKTVQEYFASVDPDCKFYDREIPVVSTEDCFDKLNIPPGHPGRSPSDTYYVNADTVLRTHTSAHQCQHMSHYPEVGSFLCAGDVYRRDEIDASHYPVFHQCEGVKIFDAEKVSQKEVQEHLKKTLEGLVAHLFNIEIGENTMRWRDDYFPFTEPSFELDIYYNGDWLEVLGCGVTHPQVVRNAGLDPEKVTAWAFGIGLERIAMVLFDIPDIRLFWSEDPRFSQQFDENAFKDKIIFKPFSKYPPVLKDISMWIPEGFVDNDMFEMIRDEGGDQVEKVDLIDEFTHPKTKKTSKAFRVTWRDMSRTLTNEEVNSMHEKVLERIVEELNVELR